MRNLVEAILAKNFDGAASIVREELMDISNMRLSEIKREIDISRYGQRSQKPVYEEFVGATPEERLMAVLESYELDDEVLNELSDDTLKSYISKAKKSKRNVRKQEVYHDDKSLEYRSKGEFGKYMDHEKKSIEYGNKREKKEKGIKNAEERLNLAKTKSGWREAYRSRSLKEDEQLDELSQNSLASYLDKAGKRYSKVKDKYIKTKNTKLKSGMHKMYKNIQRARDKIHAAEHGDKTFTYVKVPAK